MTTPCIERTDRDEECGTERDRAEKGCRAVECCVALDIPTQEAQGARKREEREAEGRGASESDRERAKDEPSKAIAAQGKAEEEQKSVKEEGEG